jgi:Short C-terminal domain
MSEYLVREEGKNGRVEIFEDRIVRTRKKTIGKDDVQTIPIPAVTGVSHDRKSLGTDEVKLTVGSVTYEWKVKNAEAMVAELHSKMFGAAGGSPTAVASDAAVTPAAAPGEEKLAKLERLSSLHASGALSDEEFAAMKAEVLDPTSGPSEE